MDLQAEFEALGGWDRRRFLRPAARVARDLLGAWLWTESDKGPVGGRIVETEAYLPAGDPGSHSTAGPTARNGAMFGPAGRAYVYRIYGMHLCFNVVTGATGSGEAVLIRALEPLLGIESMVERRAGVPLLQLARGPGNLAQALGIDLSHDCQDLCPASMGTDHRGPRIAFGAEPLPAHRVAWGTRIGLGKGQHLALRACLRGSRWVSARRALG